MNYNFSVSRYDEMNYRRCGRSGLLLPAISLGLWHNFGAGDDYSNALEMMHKSFDVGITHFDLANNYGPPPGSAEITFGRILKDSFKGYRDEILISTKAGYTMWPGPYGDWGSRKYILASLDQSLKRMGVDYVDIFYHHRFDPNTPMEETLAAIDHAVRQGKVLYAGISKYTSEQTSKAYEIFSRFGTPFIIHQPAYNMFNRSIENGLLQVLEENGLGCITFSPLAQGILSSKYLDGIPEKSRASIPDGFLRKEHITPEKIEKVLKLNDVAQSRGQTISQLALAWNLRFKAVSSVLIGASNKEQIIENAGALKRLDFTDDELRRIDEILE